MTEKCRFESLRAQWFAPYIVEAVEWALKFGTVQESPEEWWDPKLMQMFALGWKDAGAIAFE